MEKRMRDTETGEIIRFNWNGDGNPTEEDMQEIAAAYHAKKAQTAQGGTPEQLNAAKMQGFRGMESIQQAPPKWKQVTSEILHEVAPYAGAVVGGLKGAPLGPAGIAAGGALGYLGAKQVPKVVDEALLRTRVPRTWQQNLQSLPAEASEAMMQEIIPPVVSKGVSRVVGKAIMPLSREASAPGAMNVSERAMTPVTQNMQQLVGKFGYPATLGDLAPDSKTAAIFESVFSYHPWSGDVMLKRNIAKMDKMLEIRKNLINSGAPAESIEAVGSAIKRDAKLISEGFGNVHKDKLTNLAREFESKLMPTNRLEAGKTFLGVMEKDFEAKRGNVTSLYENLTQSLPGKGNETITVGPETVRRAKELLDAELSVAASQRDKTVIATLKDFMPKKGPDGEIIMPSLKWKGMDKTRSVLLEKVRSIYAREGMSTAESRVYTDLANSLDGEMKAYTSAVGLSEAHEVARGASKELHDIYDKDILGIMKAPVEDILDRIVNKGEITLLSQIKQATGNAGIEPLRRGFFRNILESSKTGDGWIDPLKMRSNLLKMTPETISALTTKEQQDVLNNIVIRGIRMNEKHQNLPLIDFLDSVTSRSDGEIINKVFKPNDTASIRLLKKLVPQERIDSLIDTVLDTKILRKSATDLYMPVKSAQEFNTYKYALKELMPADRYSALQEFIQLGKNAERLDRLAKNSSLTGQVLVGSVALSSIVSQLYPGSWKEDYKEKLGAGAFSLIAPWALAKGYISPMAMRYFNASARLDPASQEAIKLFTKGMTIIQNDIKQEGEESTNGLPLP